MRECLAAVPDTLISGKRVARELKALIAVHGKSGIIVSDNGTELTSNAVLERCSEAKIEGTIPLRASRPRTRWWRASMAGCVTSCSTRPCLLRGPMPARRSPSGPIQSAVSVPQSSQSAHSRSAYRVLFPPEQSVHAILGGQIPRRDNGTRGYCPDARAGNDLSKCSPPYTLLHNSRSGKNPSNPPRCCVEQRPVRRPQ